jgi:hypothetical protein
MDDGLLWCWDCNVFFFESCLGRRWGRSGIQFGFLCFASSLRAQGLSGVGVAMIFSIRSGSHLVWKGNAR